MTRQWVANPRFMCDQHVLGEHFETHIFLSKMEKKYSLDGFIKGSMFFGASFIKFRHDWLASIIAGHKTPLEIPVELIEAYPEIPLTEQHITASQLTLIGRCKDCLSRQLQANNQIPEYLSLESEVIPWELDYQVI